jgi:ABC-2 type transport system ATP-binding protein
MNTEVILEIKNLTKNFSNRTVIDNISLNIYKGEVLGLLGPNGAGKTTLIRLIVGLISMNDGEILINGNNLKTSFESAIRNIGAIIENPEFYKFLSGYKNLVYFSRMYSGITKERIYEVIKLVGLEKQIHEKVKNYSLGMRQRLGIAIALLHKPSIIILDEPTNGLDPRGIQELRSYLRSLAEKEGISIIVSSHILSEMELLCDRIAIINNGKLIDTRKINTEITEDTPMDVTFEVDINENFYDIIKSLNLNNYQISSNEITIKTTRKQIHIINSLLVEEDIKVFQIRYKANSLENTFMKVIGGN